MAEVAKTQPPADNSNSAYKAPSKVKSVGDLDRRFRNLKQKRGLLENAWKVNLAFYKGRQYVYINRAANRIETLPVADGDKPRWRVRLVSNQIMPGVQSLLSKYTKTKPIITATPNTSDESDFKAAKVAEGLLEYLWDFMRLNDKQNEAYLWSILCGSGYWFITWDKNAGTMMKFTIGPDGQPIVNEDLKQLFQQHLQQQGVPPQVTEKVLSLGDISVDVISPFNVVFESVSKPFEEQKVVYIQQFYDPDEVKSRWGKTLEPDSIPTELDVAMPMGEAAPEMTTVRVIHGYFVPTPQIPQGRYVCWAPASKTLLEDGPWPFPFNILPIVKFPGVKVPGSAYDGSLVEQAIPLQRELNRTLSQIVEHKNLTIRPVVWAPVGSVRTRLTNEPGQLREYVPLGNGLKPEPEQPPSIPPYVIEHLQDIGNRIKDMFNLSAVDVGQLPPNLEAATAIDLLQEMSSDRLMPAILANEKALERAGNIMLMLCQKFYIEPRTIKIIGMNGASQILSFTNADIQGGVSINIQSGSSLPRTRAGRQLRIMEYMQMGLLPKNVAYKYLDIADLKGAQADIESDEDMATREHDLILQGQPINPVAMQQAMQTVQTPDPQYGVPINPDTGEPFQSDQEMQQYVHNAGLEPTYFEDWETHINIHARKMKSAEWEQYPPEIKADFVTHFSKTYQKSYEMRMRSMLQPATPPKITLGLRGTVGPTVAAEMANKAGIFDATPQQFAEPPLETQVIDTEKHDETGQPNARSNDPYEMDQLQKWQQMEHAQEQQQQQMDQAQQQQALTMQQHQAAHHQGLQQAQHKQLSHETATQHQHAGQVLDLAAKAQKMRHAEQMHQAKIAALRQAQANRGSGATKN